MSGGSNRLSFQTGFTLLEILMAMFIVGLIMTTVYTSYTGALRNINAAENAMDNYQKARVTFERIIEDLELAYLIPDLSVSMTNEEYPGFRGFIGRDMEINGKAGDNLRFNSEAHIFFGPNKGPVGTTITYYVEESDDGEDLILFRSETLEFEKLFGEQKGFVLCDDLHSIDFVYTDINGKIYDNWDSTDETVNKNRMPVMVSITLEFRHRDGSEYPDRFTTSVSLPMAKGDDNEAS